MDAQKEGLKILNNTIIPQNSENINQNECSVEIVEKFHTKKLSALKIADRMIKAGYKKRGLLMRECSTELIYATCPCCGRKRVQSTNLCRDRMCPVCNWRLSLKRYADMCKAMPYIQGDYKYYFLTLTIKNCKGADLSKTLQQMSKAWNRMIARRRNKEIMKGWARSLEITYNKETKTHHPHYHIILVTSPTISMNDIGKEYWTSEWESALNLDYHPVCHIENIKCVDQESDTDISKAILETYKYTVKDTDALEMPMNDFKALIGAIAGKRLISSGGVIKKARSAARINEQETADIEVKEIKSCCGKEMTLALITWSWGDNTYTTQYMERGFKW